MRFETTEDTFSVEGSTPTGANDLGRNDLAMATAVLDAVADEHQIAVTDDRILVRVVKNLSPSARTA